LQKTAELRDRRNTRRWVGLVLAAFAVAILAGIAWVGMSLPSADAIQPGSYWVGTFRFLPPNQGHTGDVRVTITDRIGDRFRGTYATEGGKYEWLIEGTVQREKIRWEFSGATQGGQEAKDVVGKAWVDGTCAGEEMQMVFRDPDDDSVAEMKLRLRK
jgi:hypothetical protein